MVAITTVAACVVEALTVKTLTARCATMTRRSGSIRNMRSQCMHPGWSAARSAFARACLRSRPHAPRSHRGPASTAILIPTLGDLTVALRDPLPEFRFTDFGLIREGCANVAYESIDAITFKL